MQSEKQNEKRVVVIGSGFGGLAAAIRLQARGFQVTVLEQRDQPGGRASVYRDKGFVFDAGPTVVTAPYLFEELFSLCGRKMDDYLQLLPVNPFYKVRFHDGRFFEYCGDTDKMVEQIRAWNPEDVNGYLRFLEESERIFHVGFEQLGDVPFHRAFDMLKIVPQMLRLRSHLSVYSLVKRFIKHPDLRVLMSFHPLLVGANPFRTTSIYALILFLERKWGVWFAKGGTGALVKAMCDLFVELGGEFRLNARVEEILTSSSGLSHKVRGVRLAGGAEIPAHIVVSNADAGFTYRHLLPEDVRRHWTNERVENTSYSMGLFVAYFGTDKRYEDCAHHTIALGPRYRELLDDIFSHKRLAEDFSLYVHRPTATDLSLAPNGCDTFYVLSPVPHLGADRPVDWSQEGERYRDKIFSFLEQSLLPDLKKHIVTSRFVTPNHFRDELSSLYGSGFSVEPRLLQSAYFRPHNKSEDVDGLFIVGGGTHPGAGIPGVLSTAKVVDRLIPRLPGAPQGSPIAGSYAADV
ncbi:MAG TPA: phytoene desaturase [Pseudomonadota bacterium]|jgi:phytoene desaturase|nr:phytoene desaturase [Pseudomonadota bacterium]